MKPYLDRYVKQIFGQIPWASWINHELATRPLHVVQPPPSTSVLILRSKMSPIRMELSQRELILYHQPLHHFTSHLHLSHLFFISVMELAMLVGGVSAVSLSGSSGEGLGSPLFGSFSSSSSCTSRWLRRRGNNGLVVRGSGERSNELSTSRVVFQPFEELKKEDFLVPISPQHSLARQGYSEECEAAINEQIKWVLFLFFLSIIFSRPKKKIKDIKIQDQFCRMI